MGKVFGLIMVSILPGYVTGAHAADLKIGFVNAARILDQAPQAVLARNRLQKEFAPRDQGLVEAQRTMREMEDQLATEGAQMSESQRRRLERDIIARKREINRSREALREDFNIRRNEELEKLQRQVYEAIVNLAKQEEFDLIVNDGAVIYASEQIDITDRVLQLLK